MTAIETVLDELYMSAADPDAARRLPASLASLMGAGSSAVWTFDRVTGAPGPGFLTTVDPDMAELYVRHYHTLDPWREPVLRATLGRPVHGAMLIDDADLDRTAYYNEFGRQLETFHLLGGVMPVDEADGTTLIGFTVHRPRQGAAFDAEAHRLMERMMPHIRRLVQLRRVIEPVRDGVVLGTAGALLDAMAVPAVLTDRHGRVRHANPDAEVAEQAGLIRLNTEAGLSAPRPEATQALQRCIRNAGGGGPGGVVRVAPGAFAVIAPVLPGLGAQIGALPGHVLVVLRLVPEASEAFVQRVQDIFGLPRAEAATAAAVAAGQSPEQVAELRGVRLSTVRTLLQRTMQRVGAGNLRQLVVLLVAAAR